MNSEQAGMSGKEDVEDFTKVFTLLVSLQHSNLVQFVGAVFNKKNVPKYILSELESGGSLAKLLEYHHDMNSFLPKHFIVNFSKDILTGLNYLHTLLVIHKDLTPANILINLEGKCKLCDFGTAKKGDIENSLVETPKYFAPEFFSTPPHMIQNTPAIDIWCFGVILCDMILISISQNAFQVETEKPQAISSFPEMELILTNTLALEPHERSTSAQLLELLNELPKDFQKSFNDNDISSMNNYLQQGKNFQYRQHNYKQ
jgi:serine/threonine protein kinase